MDLSVLRAPSGPVVLDAIDPAATPGFAGGKSQGRDLTDAIAERLRLAQERLFACSRVGDDAPSVLLVLQGMDTSGKGGTVRKVIGGLDPQGVRIASFGAPTPEELQHDFLWRIRAALPGPGRVGVFDRSHYEDVLIGRVRRLAPEAEIERRYEAIEEFESALAASGTRVIKVFLHISPDEQRQRLLARLDDPRKHWKFSPADIDDRGLWRDYQQAYEIAIERTDAEHAPWHIVPAEKKWYRNLAVAALLEGTLSGLDLAWPPASFDVDEQRRRLLEEDPLR